MALLLFIILYNALQEGSSVHQCYLYLPPRDFFRRVENCTDRYGETVKTKCVSARVDKGGVLNRQQCMSVHQADSFCNKLKHFQDVTCYICDDNLCNSGKTNSQLSLLIPVVIYLIGKVS